MPIVGQFSMPIDTFYVKDNGEGFETAHDDHLFDIFQGLKTRKEYARVGIGLPIVQCIVARHGGKIWAEGAEGKGASFYFSFPKDAFMMP